tara:strand:- start:136 stop:306 length:171 start_codon:yes stop_codon:yes gene_type:complete
MSELTEQIELEILDLLSQDRLDEAEKLAKKHISDYREFADIEYDNYFSFFYDEGYK